MIRSHEIELMSLNGEDPDIKLIRSFLTNQDKRSFTSLIEKYQHDVYHFCYRFLGDADDASDCSQEIFIRIYKHLPKFSFRSKFSSWLYRIMVNACNDMAKSRKYRASHLSLERGSVDAEGSPMPIENSSAPNPEQATIRKEIQEVFQTALCKLRLQYRTVIILRDIEGRSYEEISTLTGMKLGTVRSSLSRARLEMAGFLKEYRYEM